MVLGAVIEIIDDGKPKIKFYLGVKENTLDGAEKTLEIIKNDI